MIVIHKLIMVIHMVHVPSWYNIWYITSVVMLIRTYIDSYLYGKISWCMIKGMVRKDTQQTIARLITILIYR